VHAFFFTLTQVTCITNRVLLYFAVLTQVSVIFMDINWTLCNSPNSLLKSSFINPKFLCDFSDLARNVIRLHSFIHIRLSKLWKVKGVGKLRKTKNCPWFTLLPFLKNFAYDCFYFPPIHFQLSQVIYIYCTNIGRPILRPPKQFNIGYVKKLQAQLVSSVFILNQIIH